jgi:aryl-alcohol dehydrogenase-like predicted oxidoreductase
VQTVCGADGVDLGGVMDYVPLGRTGLFVSRLALGAMTFGSGSGSLQKVDQAEADRLIGTSLDAGINLFNTAATYGGGQSEEILGKSLASYRDQVVIATKVSGATAPSVVQRRLSRRHVLDAVECSLRRLGTEFIDVLFAHHFDPVTPLEETLEAFDTVVRQGKVRYIGFSSWPAWAAADARRIQQLHGWYEFCASESYYSLLGRDLEHELIPYCTYAGLGILVWSPLAMGFLSGRYTRGDIRSQSGRSATYDVVPPFDVDHGHDVVDLLRKIAQDHGSTPAQIAIAWVLSRHEITSVLLGVSTLAQLQDNLGASDIELEDSELEALDSATRPSPIYPTWLRQQIAQRWLRAGVPADDEFRLRISPNTPLRP